MANTLWKFLDDKGTFIVKNPHKLSRLYFPLANEKATLLSSITPNLHGDIKVDQDRFLTVPATIEDLDNSRYNRNFWLYVKGKASWSASSGEVTESKLEAGLLWHKLTRINKKIGLKVEFTSFIPSTNEPVEIMSVEVTNISRKKLNITPTCAIPIYGRSLDRLRDHRHVTSLFNRIETNKYGVVLKPTMIFNEKGHKINNTSYFVFACNGNSNPPKGVFPTISEFTGEGGNLDRPEAVLKNLSPKKNVKFSRNGKEAIGAIRLSPSTLLPGKSKKYIIVMGITQKEKPD